LSRLGMRPSSRPMTAPLNKEVVTFTVSSPFMNAGGLAEVLKTKLEKYNVYELKITLDYTFDEENPRPHFANI